MKTKFSISVGYSNIAALKETEDKINKYYKDFGGEGRIVISGQLGETTVTSSGELSKEYKDKVIEVIKTNFIAGGFTDVSVTVFEVSE